MKLTAHPAPRIPFCRVAFVSRAIASRALLSTALLNATAISCTVCDSEIGREVRNGVFNEGFGATLVAVLAPFPLLLVAVCIVHHCATSESI